MTLPQNIDALLSMAQVALHNALNNPKIQEYLSVYGYDSEKIKAGQALYQAGLNAQQQQKLEYGEQIGATKKLNQVWEVANKSYVKLVKIGRIAYKNDLTIFTQLGLGGDRKKSLSGWLLQAKQFYTNLLGNSQAIALLNEYGITKEKLQTAEAELKAVEMASFSQTTEKGEAQNATQVRDIAVDALNDWLSDYVAIARIALETEPQLLESLGILERS